MSIKPVNYSQYAMSYSEIAEQLTIETGIKHTENQVKLICFRALQKLSEDPIVRSMYDFLKDCEKS